MNSSTGSTRYALGSTPPISSPEMVDPEQTVNSSTGSTPIRPGEHPAHLLTRGVLDPCLMGGGEADDNRLLLDRLVRDVNRLFRDVDRLIRDVDQDLDLEPHGRGRDGPDVSEHWGGGVLLGADGRLGGAPPQLKICLRVPSHSLLPFCHSIPLQC